MLTNADEESDEDSAQLGIKCIRFSAQIERGQELTVNSESSVAAS